MNHDDLNSLHPYILGSGRAARALERSLTIAGGLHPELNISPPVRVPRGSRLSELPPPNGRSILLIANPHGLHAQAILDAVRAGFAAVVTEKPACVLESEIAPLKSLPVPVAVCHVYRQLWGPQLIKSMVKSGELGALISIEGRYWQSSAAKAAQLDRSHSPKTWKSDVKLSGAHDALLDLGAHWVDAALYLAGESPSQTRVWRSYANAESAHRDTHLHLWMNFPSGLKALSSISKTFHGAANHFEINVLGARKSVSWNFMRPDEIEIGEGGRKSIVYREDIRLGSGQMAFHGLGWLEGYVEIFNGLFRVLQGRDSAPTYPTLFEGLESVGTLLRATEFT